MLIVKSKLMVGSSTAMRSMGFRLFEVGHGVANLKPIHARDGAQVAAADMLDFLFAQAREHVQFFGAHLFVALRRAQGVVLVGVEVAAVQPSNGNPPRVLAVIEGGDLELGVPSS